MYSDIDHSDDFVLKCKNGRKAAPPLHLNGPSIIMNECHYLRNHFVRRTYCFSWLRNRLHISTTLLGRTDRVCVRVASRFLYQL